MNIHDISTYLLRFDALPAEAPVFEELIEAPNAEIEKSSFYDDVLREPIDIEALHRDFEDKLTVALQRQQEEHLENIRRAREQWVEQEAEILSRCLADGLESAFESLRTDVARVLSPFVSKEIEETALDELVSAIRRAIADEHCPVIRIEGPKDLIGRVGLGFTREGSAVNLIEREGIDALVELDITRIETRLDAWLNRLADSRNNGL